MPDNPNLSSGNPPSSKPNSAGAPQPAGRPDAGHIPMTEEMDSARWTMPPILPLLAGLVLVAIAVAVSFLRTRAPEAAPEPEPVSETPAEPDEGGGIEKLAPAIRARPLPAYAAAPGAGCQETGMRVVIGCGGCAGSAP